MQPMNVIIEIDAPQLLPHLRARLEAGGCSAHAISSHACRVLHQHAVDVDEAMRELRFFVRAWALSHGDVAVSLRPDV
jgi:hypothetical protein